MVRVVIDDRDAPRHAELLETPLRPGERREGLGRGGRWNPERIGCGERAGGVARVVRTREAQRDRNHCVG